MTTPEVVRAAPQKTSAFEDIVDIFHAPSAVFARRREDPRFWAPLLVLTVLMSIGIWLMMQNLSTVMDAEFARQSAKVMRENPRITEDQLATMRRMGSIIAPIGAAFAAFVSVFLLALGVWVLGKFFESKANLAQAMVIATFASFPKIIDLILASVMGLALDTSDITSMYAATPSAARFAGEQAPSVLAMLSRISIGTVWATVLIGIGLHVIGRIEKGKAYTAAAILWVLATIITVGGAMRQA